MPVLMYRVYEYYFLERSRSAVVPGSQAVVLEDGNRM